MKIDISFDIPDTLIKAYRDKYETIQDSWDVDTTLKKVIMDEVADRVRDCFESAIKEQDDSFYVALVEMGVAKYLLQLDK